MKAARLHVISVLGPTRRWSETVQVVPARHAKAKSNQTDRQSLRGNKKNRYNKFLPVRLYDRAVNICFPFHNKPFGTHKHTHNLRENRVFF